ncbi:MAG: DUF2092 domain-containing protein [bacterium]
MVRKSGWFVGLMMGCAIALHLSAGAAEEAAGAMDPKVDEVVKQLSSFLAGLKNYSVNVDITVLVEAQGMKQEMVTKQSLALQRPDKMAMVLKDGMMGGTVVSDGKNLYRYIPMLQAYTVEDAPESIDALSSVEPGGGMGMAMGAFNTAFIEFLVKNDPYESFFKEMKGGQYVGEEDLEGTATHRVRLNQEEMSVDLWIDKGDKPLVRKLVPDMSKIFERLGGAAAGMMKDMKMSMGITLADWKTNTELPADTFVFTPPEGAKKVDSFEAAMGGEAMRGDASPKSETDLLGQPAPGFQLELLNGENFSLAGQKGQVVILDFWATWCGPCRQAMPVMEKVTSSFKDQGVKLIAVNLQEDAAIIQKFLKQMNLHPTVALDREGKVAEQYGVQVIPTTVLIGKDGTVQAVHLGNLPNLKDTLESELKALINGKALVAEKQSVKAIPRKGMSQVARAKADMRALRNALEMFFIDNDKYPVPLEGRTLDQAGLKVGEESQARILRLTGPVQYVDSLPADPFDPEDKPYRYFSDGKFYILVSNGPDGDVDFDERTFKGGKIDTLREFIFDPEDGETSSGDIIVVGP